MHDGKTVNVVLSEEVAAQPTGQMLQTLTETINRALHQAQEELVQELLQASGDSNTLFSRVSELQADMHQAFLNDLAKAVSPAQETLRRFG